MAGEDDDAAFSASHCLDSAMAVVDAVGEDPACLAALARHVLPVVHWALTTDGCYEYLDHAVGFLSYYTYRCPSRPCQQPQQPLSNSLLFTSLPTLTPWASCPTTRTGPLREPFPPLPALRG